VPPDVTARAFPNVRVPIVPDCEKRFVELAVVPKKLVVVPDVRERVPRVKRPFTERVPIVPVFAFKAVEVAVPK
jgi:hypothetical protein